MPLTTFEVNGNEVTVEVDTKIPLLWVLRDTLGLTGTKFGCGTGWCGSCSVLINGEAKNSCIYPTYRLAGKSIVTIEGLSPDGSHPVQRAWLEGQVSQCGYCQPGMILAIVALLRKHPDPSEAKINEALVARVCRCGTHGRIRKAIARSVELIKGAEATGETGATEETEATKETEAARPAEVGR